MKSLHLSHQVRTTLGKLFKDQQARRLLLAGALSAGVTLGGTGCEGKKDLECTQENPAWKEQHWFAPDLRSFKDTLLPGVVILRHQGMNCYLVKAGDTLRSIWQKLASTSEFSYLQQDEYQPRRDIKGGRNLKGFNFDGSSLQV